MNNETERLKTAIGEEKDRIAAERAREAAIAFGCVLLRNVDPYEVTCVAHDKYQIPYHGMTLIYDLFYDKVTVKYRMPFWFGRIINSTAYLRQSRKGAEELLEILEKYGKYNPE